MKKLIGFIVVLIFVSNGLQAQRNGCLYVGISTSYHYEDNFKIIDFETEQVLLENNSFYCPKRNFEGKVIVQHPLGITDTVFVRLKRRRNYENIELRPSQAFLDSIVALEKDVQLRLARIKDCPEEFDAEPVMPSVGEQDSIIEIPAMYPGGLVAMRKDLVKGIRYPEEAMELGLSGKVYLKFVIDEEGLIRCATVLKGMPDCRECDEEALKALIYLKQFDPALNDGLPVKSYYTLPIAFNTQ